LENKFIFIDGLKPQTRLLIGALAQIALSLLLPARWALVPAGILTANALIRTILQTFSPTSNEFTQGVVPGRATAQLPSSDGTHGHSPAAKDVVVFQLGIQYNHPLGPLAPVVKDISAQIIAMEADLKKKRDEYGMLSVSYWRGDERGSNNTLLLSFFFRDVEGVHRFAHDELHRKTWDWFNAQDHSHVGIFHETYCVPAKAYETIYVNCRPVLMGRAEIQAKSDSGEGWASSLVNANTPVLKTQYARLSRHENGTPKE
jgi:hypothetical protein